MADDLERPGEDSEEHGGERHLPSPSFWPFGFALGVSIVLLGLIVDWTVALVGAVLTVLFGFLWIRDATRDFRGTPPPEPPRRDVVEEEEEEEAPRYPRSVFLEGATLGIGAAIGGVVMLPSIGFAVLPAFVDQDYDEVDLGPVENFPSGSWRVTTFLSAAGQPEGVVRRTAYIRNNGVEDGVPSFTILSNRCVHLGCPVQPQGLTEEPEIVETESGPVHLAATEPSGFGCPCHGGAYDLEGNRTAGPPVRALDRYRYSIRGGRLVLGQPYSVAHVEGRGAQATMEAYRISDPGVHVDGLSQYFYPYVP